jgi:hypothetical protein
LFHIDENISANSILYEMITYKRGFLGVGVNFFADFLGCAEGSGF